MKDTIELIQDIGYKYFINHKSLFYWPNQDHFLQDKRSVAKYRKELLKLYKIPNVEHEVHFVQLKPQTIQNAIGLTNQIIFEVTEKCNLSCAYCGLGDTYQQVSEERCLDMNWQTAKTVLDFYIREWKKERPKNFSKFCHIGFYGGEPLLNMPLIKKIICYIEEQGEDWNFRYSMTTNGTLLHKHLEYLIEKDFIFSVSLDGDKEMNSYRVYNNGKEVYSDLFANLKKIQKEYPKYFEENIEFISIANSINTNEGIISFFNKEFNKSPQINKLMATSVANYDRWNSMRRKYEDVKKVDSKNQYLSDYLNLFSGNFYYNYRSLLDNSGKIVKTPTGTCLPFSKRVFISAREDIIACERVGFKRILGKVTDKRVDIDFENLASFYNNIYDKFKVQCESCFKKESCNICFLTDEQYFEENFKCEDFYPVSHLKKCIVESVITLRERAFDTNN